MTSEELQDKIRPHADLILKEAGSGNEKALAVVRLYKLHQRCPADPGALGLCCAAFEEWFNEHPALSSPLL